LKKLISAMQITPNQLYERSDALPVLAEGLQEAMGNVSIDQSPNSHAKLIILARMALGFFVPTASMGIAWVVVGIFAVTDLIWLQSSKLRIASDTRQQIMHFCIFLAAMSVLPILLQFTVRLLVRSGLAADTSGMANFIGKCVRSLTLFVLAILFVRSLIYVGTLFEYLAASVNLPLLDPSLDVADRALGFDWSSFFATVNAHPVVNSILTFAYGSTIPVMLGVLVILCCKRDICRLGEFLAVFAVSLLCTLAIGAFMPAVGAFTQHASVGDLFSRWPFFQTIQSLRNDTTPILDFSDSQGLVTFPSFHAVMAIITTYALRDLRVVSLLGLVILNSLEIISTLTEGGHYLVDVIGGIIVAVASIFFIAAVESRSRTISAFVTFAMPHRTDA
jgi:membrane-associated phospholipid phosphatase